MNAATELSAGDATTIAKRDSELGPGARPRQAQHAGHEITNDGLTPVKVGQRAVDEAVVGARRRRDEPQQYEDDAGW